MVTHLNKIVTVVVHQLENSVFIFVYYPIGPGGISLPLVIICPRVNLESRGKVVKSTLLESIPVTRLLAILEKLVTCSHFKELVFLYQFFGFTHVCSICRYVWIQLYSRIEVACPYDTVPLLHGRVVWGDGVGGSRRETAHSWSAAFLIFQVNESSFYLNKLFHSRGPMFNVRI